MNIEDQVKSAIDKRGVSFRVFFSGIQKRDNWDCYAWTVQIDNQSFEYFKGMGHGTTEEKANRKFGTINPFHKWLKQEKLKSEQVIRSMGHYAIKPTPAEVFYALLMDSEAENQSFSDWCDSFGFNNDSISDFEIYRKCEENAKKLREVFKGKSGLKDELQTLLEGY